MDDEDVATAFPLHPQLLAAVTVVTGHSFCDHELLRQALTHASACSGQASALDRLAEHNERLEFLGDALLGAAIADILHLRFADANEGLLSRCKSQLVSRKTLAAAIDRHGIMDYAIMGQQMNAAIPLSVRANIAEGLLGAVFREAGWAALRQAVATLLAEEIEAVCKQPQVDAKNSLQMWCLEHFSCLPEYQSQRSGGSDHAPHFSASVSIDHYHADGVGHSRRAAERAAARALLALLQAAATTPTHNEQPS